MRADRILKRLRLKDQVKDSERAYKMGLIVGHQRGVLEANASVRELITKELSNAFPNTNQPVPVAGPVLCLPDLRTPEMKGAEA